jgi:hypothetical protein
MKEAFKAKINSFLSEDSIAVFGYSSKKHQPANGIYDRFRQAGKRTYAINPRHVKLNDVRCYSSLRELPEKPGSVVICSPPESSPDIVGECIRSGIKNVWMHRSVDKGSYNEQAEQMARDNGLNCISVGCPLMFLKADFPHRCIKWIMNLQGKFK